MSGGGGDFQAMVSRLKSMNSEQLISTMGKSDSAAAPLKASDSADFPTDDRFGSDSAAAGQRSGRKRKASVKAAEAAEDAAEAAQQVEHSKQVKPLKAKALKTPKPIKAVSGDGRKKPRVQKPSTQPAASSATLFAMPPATSGSGSAPSLFKPSEAAPVQADSAAVAEPQTHVEGSQPPSEVTPAVPEAPAIPAPGGGGETEEAAIPAPSPNELPDHPLPDLTAFSAMSPDGTHHPPDTAQAMQLLSAFNSSQRRGVGPDGTPLETPVVPVLGSEGGESDTAAAAVAAAAAAAAVAADAAASPAGASEASTKYTGVRRNKGGRYSARIKLGGTNKYLGSFKTAEEAARAFDACAIENGRPVETLNFPAAYGGPTVGQAYRKRKVHRLYADPHNHINILLQKLADVDRSNPGILRLTMGTLGVPESRYLPDNKYAGIRQQASHWETRIRYKDKLYSMGFFASVEAAALAWDITAASLRRCRKLNFPEVSFADLEQQLDALKCVIAQANPPTALPPGVMRMPPVMPPGDIVEEGPEGDGGADADLDPGEEDEQAHGAHGGLPPGIGDTAGVPMPVGDGDMAIPPPGPGGELGLAPAAMMDNAAVPPPSLDEEPSTQHVIPAVPVPDGGDPDAEIPGAVDGMVDGMAVGGVVTGVPHTADAAVPGEGASTGDGHMLAGDLQHDHVGMPYEVQTMDAAEAGVVPQGAEMEHPGVAEDKRA